LAGNEGKCNATGDGAQCVSQESANWIVRGGIAGTALVALCCLFACYKVFCAKSDAASSASRSGAGADSGDHVLKGDEYKANPTATN
jgi:hypothetical protein